MTDDEGRRTIRWANMRLLIAEKFGGNKAAFSRATKIKPDYTWRVLSSTYSKGIGEKIALRIESNLGLEMHWMDEAHTREEVQELRVVFPQQTLPPNQEGSVKWAAVGVISVDALTTARGRITAAFVKTHRGGEVFSNQEHGESAFAIQVPDGSTEPQFRVGEHVIIDPDASPRAGDWVLARVAMQVPVLRAYRPRGSDMRDGFELRPANDAYASIHSTGGDDIEFMGVVTEYHWYRSRHPSN